MLNLTAVIVGAVIFAGIEKPLIAEHTPALTMIIAGMIVALPFVIFVAWRHHAAAKAAAAAAARPASYFTGRTGR